jgi:hypothetical protein
MLIPEWIEDYRSKWPDPTSLQNEIDDYMMKFDEHTAKKQEEAAAKRGEPDEEGWITVSRPKKGLKPSELSRSDLRRAKKKRKQKVRFFEDPIYLVVSSISVCVGTATFLPVSATRNKART